MTEYASTPAVPSDGWFREITERAGDTFYRIQIKPELDILFISDTIERHIGYTAAELIADPHILRRAIASEDAEQFAALMHGRAGDPLRVDLRWIHRDGHVVWVEHHGVFREGPGGAVVLEGTGFNITEEMRLKESLEESETRFRLLAENASDLIVMTGPDGLLQWISPSVTRLMGWRGADAMGKPPEDFIHAQDLPAVGEALARVMAGESASATARLRMADGSYRWFDSTITPILDADGGYAGRISAFHDIDELVRAEQNVRNIMDAQLDPNITLRAVRDDTGRIVDLQYVHANAAAIVYTSRLTPDPIGRSFIELFPDQLQGGPLEMYMRTIETGEPTILDDYVFNVSRSHPDHHYDIRGVKVGDAISITWRDVTERSRAATALAASEEQYRLLAENSSDVVMHTRDNYVVWVSPALTRMLGWATDEWLGHSLAEFGHPDDLDTVVAAREEMLSGTSVVMRIRIKDSQGVYHWAEVHSRLYVNAAGRIDGIQSSMRTIDREVQAEQDLERRARYDDLTGVFKRDEAIARLGDVTRRRRVPGSESAALFIDLDGFKKVNDTYGHAAGDAVLETLTVRIRDAVRAGDTIARMGGDEFVVILDAIHGLDEATAVAEKIRTAAARPIPTAAGPVQVTVSVGVTLTTSLESADAVIARADAAMYRAKDGGRDRVVSV